MGLYQSHLTRRSEHNDACTNRRLRITNVPETSLGFLAERQTSVLTRKTLGFNLSLFKYVCVWLFLGIPQDLYYICDAFSEDTSG